MFLSGSYNESSLIAIEWTWNEKPKWTKLIKKFFIHGCENASEWILIFKCQTTVQSQDAWNLKG